MDECFQMDEATILKPYNPPTLISINEIPAILLSSSQGPSDEKHLGIGKDDDDGDGFQAWSHSSLWTSGSDENLEDEP